MCIRDRYRLILTASLTMVLVSIGFIYFSNPPSYSVMNELRLEGDAIVKQIEAYFQLNQKYPDSLVLIKIENDNKRYGGWKYTREINGSSFVLSTGDYSEYLFELSWDSNLGEWYLDS